MAYMDQERKALLAAELKKVMPAGWKYSLAVRNHSTIVLTITEAPFDLMAVVVQPSSRESGHYQVNNHHPLECFTDECVGEAFKAIVAALNAGNHDRSDSYTDYYDVGWYVDVQIGRWNKPFRHAPATEGVMA